jgi:hypothetical protein
MNPLSWFKEFALRSKTADVMSGIRDKAHADAQQNLTMLQGRQYDKEDLAAKLGASLEGERIQQAGLTEREQIESIRRAAERAVAFETAKRSQRNTERDDLFKLDSPEAVEAFASGATELTPSDIAAAVAAAKARVAAKPSPDEALFTEAGKFDTEDALNVLMKDPKFAAIAKTPRFQAIIREAQAKDAERKSLQAARNKPPVDRGDTSSPEAIEGTIMRLEDFVKEIEQGDPEDPRIPALKARIKQHESRLAEKMGGNPNSKLLQFIMSPAFLGTTPKAK